MDDSDDNDSIGGGGSSGWEDDEQQRSGRAKLMTAATYSLLWIALLTFLAGWFAAGQQPASVLFTWHPVLMVTAFVAFFGHGILVYRSPYRTGPLVRHRLAHAMLQTAGVFTALLGLTVILVNKIFIVQHSTVPGTLHAYFGVVTLAAMALQAVLGVTKVCLRRSPLVLKLHGPFGILILLSALCTACIGLYYHRNTSVYPILTYVQMGLLCAFGVAVVVQRALIDFPREDLRRHWQRRHRSRTPALSTRGMETGSAYERRPLVKSGVPYPFTV